MPAAALRMSVLRLLVALLASGALMATAGEFPYVAYVVDADAYVRSGPGREHYPTSQLPAGYAVEVYRHDGAGWCAIRPPEGSFSLAPVHELRLIDERTAEVVGDRVVARVGSALGDQRSAVQVMLQRGERIALLEPPSPTRPWVRIAPPAGEFRWIAARRLSRTPPVEAPAGGAGWQSRPLERLAAAGASPDAEPAESAAPSGDAFAHLTGGARAASTAALATASGSAMWQPVAPDAASGAAAPAAGAAGDEIQIIAGSPAAVLQAQYEDAAAAPGPTQPPAGAATAPPPEPATASTAPRIRFEGGSAPVGPLDPRVGELQLRLSQIVVGPPTSWQFAGLREETSALLAQEPSATVREQLRDLLDRIITFESVQARYRGAAGAWVPPPTAATARPGAGAALGTSDGSEVLSRVASDLGVGAAGAASAMTPTPGGPAPPAAEALYDAVGTLKPVVSRRPNAPQFALIDDHGDVVTFVTAAPDVNLQAYLGQRIGVRGSRGFMPEYRRAHVTASRVTPLETRLVK